MPASLPILRTAAPCALLAAGFLLASCAHEPLPPHQVQASSPTVTYTYRGDEELVQADQRADTYCSQYRLAPRAAGVASLDDGKKSITYECVPGAASTMAAQPWDPTVMHSYRSDQELLDASHNADLYCMEHGSQRAVATVVTNPDGSRNLSFACEAP